MAKAPMTGGKGDKSPKTGKGAKAPKADTKSKGSSSKPKGGRTGSY